MKHIVCTVLLGVCGGNIVYNSFIEQALAPVVYAREPEAPEVVLVEPFIEWTPLRIEKEIKEQAEKYGVNALVMNKVIACESMGSTTIQSRHVKNGVREESYGLAQIHLPSHPEITREQATDPMFAIEFMAKEMGKGNAWKWTCWRNL